MESSPKEEGFSEEGSIEKSCYYCKTTKTPLWRSGPSGPKSLCNACGIRLRKKRVISPHAGRAKKPGTGSSEKPDAGSSEDDEVKLDTGSVENEEVKPDSGSTENDAKKKSKIGRKKKKKKKKGMKLKNGMKVNLLGVKRITSPRQWSEVERAALLLMALSCGAVFA